MFILFKRTLFLFRIPFPHSHFVNLETEKTLSILIAESHHHCKVNKHKINLLLHSQRYRQSSDKRKQAVPKNRKTESHNPLCSIWEVVDSNLYDTKYFTTQM